MKVERREATYQRKTPWPFFYSVISGKVRRNVQPAQKDLKSPKETA